MKHPGVLIVDSDARERAKYASVLSKARYTVHKAPGCAEALGILEKHRGKLIVLSELDLNGESGLQFLEGTLRKYPFLPFTFFASAPPLESVIEALKKGAYDFLRKPVSPDILRHSVARSVQKLELTLETEQQHREIRKLYLLNRSELKRARNLSAFKGFMISMAAHDFRSILTVLDGYLQLLRERCDDGPSPIPSEILQQATRTIGRMRSMADTLFDYEAAESGTIRLEVRPFPLSDALRECVDFYRPYAEQKKVQLSLEGDPGNVLVAGDRGKVMEILDNLVYNALKFTPAKGAIRLSGCRGRWKTAWLRYASRIPVPGSRGKNSGRSSTGNRWSQTSIPMPDSGWDWPSARCSSRHKRGKYGSKASLAKVPGYISHSRSRDSLISGN